MGIHLTPYTSHTPIKVLWLFHCLETAKLKTIVGRRPAIFYTFQPTDRPITSLPGHKGRLQVSFVASLSRQFARPCAIREYKIHIYVWRAFLHTITYSADDHYLNGQPIVQKLITSKIWHIRPSGLLLVISYFQPWHEPTNCMSYVTLLALPTPDHHQQWIWRGL